MCVCSLLFIINLNFSHGTTYVYNNEYSKRLIFLKDLKAAHGWDLTAAHVQVKRRCYKVQLNKHCAFVFPVPVVCSVYDYDVRVYPSSIISLSPVDPPHPTPHPTPLYSTFMSFKKIISICYCAVSGVLHVLCCCCRFLVLL